MKVNGEVVTTLGTKAVEGKDLIEVDGVEISPSYPRKYILVNKPPGVITSVSDPQGRRTVMDLIPEKAREGARIFPVGRLDRDSQGLILLTNDGFLANRLLHPSFEVERVYQVMVTPAPRVEQIKSIRNQVNRLGGGLGRIRVALKGAHGNRGLVEVRVNTGKKRQIRRSFAADGYRVLSLIRTRFGSLDLGSLKPGTWRELLPAEVKKLYKDTNL